MITRYIDVDGAWGILISYDFDEREYDDIEAALHSLGLNQISIDKALNVLSAPNTGLAVSNDALRMTSIYIGRATSNSKFWSTINHELFHAEQAILDYYGEDWEGEPPAYLAGYLLQKTVEEIATPCY